MDKQGRLLGLVFVMVWAGCQSPQVSVPEAEAEVASVGQALSSAAPPSNDRSAVAIRAGKEVCSGVFIMPTTIDGRVAAGFPVPVVLTAAHCVRGATNITLSNLEKPGDRDFRITPLDKCGVFLAPDADVAILALEEAPRDVVYRQLSPRSLRAGDKVNIQGAYGITRASKDNFKRRSGDFTVRDFINAVDSENDDRPLGLAARLVHDNMQTKVCAGDSGAAVIDLRDDLVAGIVTGTTSDKCKDDPQTPFSFAVDLEPLRPWIASVLQKLQSRPPECAIPQVLPPAAVGLPPAVIARSVALVDLDPVRLTSCRKALGPAADTDMLASCVRAVNDLDPKQLAACALAPAPNVSAVGSCADGTTEGRFSDGAMVGCAGRVGFADRAGQCGAGSHVCSAGQWLELRGGLGPTFNFWTNDPLQLGGTPGSCAAVRSGGTDCGANTPVRVCDGASDALGNTCAQTNCGFDTALPDEFFGGCAVNPTAGALCCVGADVGAVTTELRQCTAAIAGLDPVIARACSEVIASAGQDVTKENIVACARRIGNADPTKVRKCALTVRNVQTAQPVELLDLCVSQMASIDPSVVAACTDVLAAAPSGQLNIASLTQCGGALTGIAPGRLAACGAAVASGLAGEISIPSVGVCAAQLAGFPDSVVATCGQLLEKGAAGALSLADLVGCAVAVRGADPAVVAGCVASVGATGVADAAGLFECLVQVAGNVAPEVAALCSEAVSETLGDAAPSLAAALDCAAAAAKFDPKVVASCRDALAQGVSGSLTPNALLSCATSLGDVPPAVVAACKAVLEQGASGRLSVPALAQCVATARGADPAVAAACVHVVTGQGGAGTASDLITCANKLLQIDPKLVAACGEFVREGVAGGVVSADAIIQCAGAAANFDPAVVSACTNVAAQTLLARAPRRNACGDFENGICAYFGCGCVRQQCVDGGCPGTRNGCTDKEISDCAAAGCGGCQDGVCFGGMGCGQPAAPLLPALLSCGVAIGGFDPSVVQACGDVLQPNALEEVSLQSVLQCGGAFAGIDPAVVAACGGVIGDALGSNDDGCTPFERAVCTQHFRCGGCLRGQCINGECGPPVDGCNPLEVALCAQRDCGCTNGECGGMGCPPAPPRVLRSVVSCASSLADLDPRVVNTCSVVLQQAIGGNVTADAILQCAGAVAEVDPRVVETCGSVVTTAASGTLPSVEMLVNCVGAIGKIDPNVVAACGAVLRDGAAGNVTIEGVAQCALALTGVDPQIAMACVPLVVNGAAGTATVPQLVSCGAALAGIDPMIVAACINVVTGGDRTPTGVAACAAAVATNLGVDPRVVAACGEIVVTTAGGMPPGVGELLRCVGAVKNIPPAAVEACINTVESASGGLPIDIDDLAKCVGQFTEIEPSTIASCLRAIADTVGGAIVPDSVIECANRVKGLPVASIAQCANVTVPLTNFQGTTAGDHLASCANLVTSLAGLVTGTFCLCPSPIVIDVDGDGFDLTGPLEGVMFDLRADGRPLLLSWTKRGDDDAWLALDRNGNGLIDDGHELFGDFTEQPDSSRPNGYLALAEFDEPRNGGNGNGFIGPTDRVFARLRLWRDADHDGESDPGELATLDEARIRALSLHYHRSLRRDRNGNEFRYRSYVIPRFGSDVSWLSYDVFLRSIDITTVVP